MTAPEVERRIADALVARTQHVYGDAASLRELQRRLPARRRFGSGPMLAAAAAVVLIVAGAAYVGDALRTDDQPSPAAPAGRAPAEGTGYRPTNHFVAVTRAGRSVIVRADGTVVRMLPKTLGGAVLSPDGNRVYGVWRSPGPKEINGTPVRTEHVSYIRLADNHVIVVATKPGTVTGLSLSADGGTIAYALLDRSVTPERTTIFVHDLNRDRDWAYRVPEGRQVIPMSLSPDGSRLAFTQTHTKDVLFIARVANPRAVVDADPTPRDLNARPVPALTCPRGMYYNPQWTTLGLFAVRQCDQSSRTEFSIVRLDPDAGRELTVVVRALPAGVSQMHALALGGRPTFLVDGEFRGQPAVYVVGRTTSQRRLPGLNSLSGP